MRAQYARRPFDDHLEDEGVPRPALGDGSGGPPTDEGERSAEIIRFPLDRPPGDVSDASSAGADTPDSGAIWSAWMNSTLSIDPLAGLRADA